jgi:hypothetical protein
MEIEKIKIAAEALRQAIIEATGPPKYPANDKALYRAVDRIIDAVVSELVIELRRGDPDFREVGG